MNEYRSIIINGKKDIKNRTNDFGFKNSKLDKKNSTWQLFLRL